MKIYTRVSHHLARRWIYVNTLIFINSFNSDLKCTCHRVCWSTIHSVACPASTKINHVPIPDRNRSVAVDERCEIVRTIIIAWSLTFLIERKTLSSVIVKRIYIDTHVSWKGNETTDVSYFYKIGFMCDLRTRVI